jgi:hypothetical protein
LISAGKQVSLAKVGELSDIVGEDGVDPIGDSLDQASQEVRGRGRITFSCSSTKANFDVRSIATMRRSLPSAIRISAMSTWN